MAFKTMTQLITDTEKAIYQSAGTSVQIYSQDIIMQQLQHAFTHLFDLHWWPRFIVREVLTLDGTTGQATVPAFITEFKDIRYVFAGTYTRPIPEMPLGLNPANTIAANGGLPRFLEGTNDTKLVRVYPLNATGTITLVGRARPADFVLADPVPFDSLLLTHFAAWSYFTDDGSSPASAQRHQGLFENRLKQIEDSEFNAPIRLDRGSNDIPSRWSEYPY